MPSTPHPDPVPDGRTAVIPYLVVAGASAAIDFYRNAFGAIETMRLAYPDGRIGHAELVVDGAARFMIADEHPEYGCFSPGSIGGSPVSLMIYVEDVDARFAQAVAAGATVKSELRDEFYGDRTGRLIDPFGHVWTLSMRIEDLDMATLQRRFDDLVSESPQP